MTPAEMSVDDMIFISVDDHVVEPPHLFDGRLPAKFADRAPTGRAHERRQRRVGVRRAARSPTSGSTPSPAAPRRSTASTRPSFDEMRPGCFDVARAGQGHERRRRARLHVLPVVPVVLRAACSWAPTTRTSPSPSSQAYNDWHIDEWCGTHPGRFIPMALPVLWDPELCAAEIRRVAAKGCHSLTFTENPATLGLPSFHDAHWDPMWRALVDEGHGAQRAPRLVGQARRHRARRADGRDDHAAADEHLHGRRRPRVVAGVQGVPRRCASRCPRAAPAGSRTSSIASTAPTTCTTRGRARTSATACRPTCSASTSSRASSPTPSGSRCATRSASTTSAGSRTTRTPTRRGPTRPRSSSRWRRATTCRDADLDKITHENAMRWYQFDPFAHRSREQCTVSALRA